MYKYTPSQKLYIMLFSENIIWTCWIWYWTNLQNPSKTLNSREWRSTLTESCYFKKMARHRFLLETSEPGHFQKRARLKTKPHPNHSRARLYINRFSEIRARSRFTWCGARSRDAQFKALGASSRDDAPALDCLLAEVVITDAGPRDLDLPHEEKFRFPREWPRDSIYSLMPD